MRILGAILAGGHARRFGGDKGAALLGKSALIDHVFDALVPQVTKIAIVGREWPGLPALPDRPAGHLGPLAGLNAALHHAQANGFEAVLTAGCDTLPLPRDLAERLGPAGPAFVAGHYTMGLWPASLAGLLDGHLREDYDRSMRGWIERCSARAVSFPTTFHNINTPEDLAAYARTIES